VDDEEAEVSEAGGLGPQPAGSSSRPTVDDLVRAKGAKPIRSVEDVQSYAIELFESDEEVEEFLAFVREFRKADLS
jgi:hypothetical protein